MRKFAFGWCMFVVLFAQAVFAGEAVVHGDGSVNWQAGVDGVEIEWGSDGAVKRIFSRYSTPVEFPDRRGISKAQIIAEEKAKANIIRFMSQGVTSTRIVAELQLDVNRATQQRASGSSAAIKKVDERTMAEALAEVTTSFAAGNLMGVIVLEKGYDDKLHEAWVKVGVSDRTIAAARGVRTMGTEPSGSSRVAPPSDIGAQGREIRRSNQRDW